eukprot:COSAG05_NODE_13016_length_444_cov_20.388406_1_plen_21_part_10
MLVACMMLACMTRSMHDSSAI